MNQVVNWFRNLIAGESGLKKELGLTIYDSEKHSGLLRFLTIRTSHATGELMVTLTALQEEPSLAVIGEALRKDLPFVSTFASVINSTRAQIATGNVVKIHFGNGYITDKIRRYSFRISPLSSFKRILNKRKSSTESLTEIWSRRRKFSSTSTAARGVFSLCLSEEVDEIYGFELVESAVMDAKGNADFNGVKNTKFIQTVLVELFKGRNVVENFESRNIPKPDAIVLDPPRSGLHPKIAANLHLLGANTIIYVSCNPTTQARDVKEIVSHGYKPVYCQPVDMFPQTYHIENVLSLVKS